MKLAAIGPCLALFAVVCNDLRLGRQAEQHLSVTPRWIESSSALAFPTCARLALNRLSDLRGRGVAAPGTARRQPPEPFLMALYRAYDPWQC
jgi:hypothetical protein